jgi:hypothetical protein
MYQSKHGVVSRRLDQDEQHFAQMVARDQQQDSET